MLNNEDLKIPFNGKNLYIEMSSHEFLDCLSYYITQKKMKTKLYRQLVHMQKKFEGAKEKNLSEYTSEVLYYHLPLEKYRYYSQNAFSKRMMDIYTRSQLVEVYLIMEILGISDPFYISFLDNEKKKLFGGIMNSGIDLWTKLRLYFNIEGLERSDIYELIDITYAKYKSYFYEGKNSMDYYCQLLEKIGAKLTCFVPEELLIGVKKTRYEQYRRYYIDDMSSEKATIKNNVSLYSMQKALDYAFQLALEKDGGNGYFDIK